jgi:transposase
MEAIERGEVSEIIVAHKDRLALSEREYVCDRCGFTLDRDWNAALNLKALGLRVLACGQPGAGAISVA